MTITNDNDVIFGSGEGYFGRSGTDPVSTVLSDGRIAVAWNEYQYPGDGSIPGIDFDTWTRILNADGTPATEAMLVNDTRVGSHASAEITALSDGGYVIGWITMNRATVEGGTQTVYTYDAHVRSFTAAGAPEGPAVLVSPDLETYDPADYNSILASNIENVNIVSLAGGGAVVIYEYRGGGSGYSYGGTHARIVGNDGQSLGEPVRVWEGGLFNLDAVQLSNGDLAFVEFAGDLSGYRVRLSAADLTSAPATIAGASGPVVIDHDPQPDQNAGGYGSAPRIAALSDGGFAVLYGYNVQLGADDDESLRIDRFDAQGGYQSTVSIPVPDDTVQQPGAIPYEILELSGNRLLVAWSHVVAYGDTDIMAVVINADGSLDSAPAVINPNTANYQLLGDLTALPDGDVFMSLADTSGVQVGGVADYMHGLFLGMPEDPGANTPVVRIGTTGDDRLVGTANNDTLRGLDGNDTLEGRDGDDQLFGGDDNDLVLGGDGSDTMAGDGGNDTLRGGNSAADLRDVIYGGAGDDDIDGGYGNDELRGDAGNDTIVGGYGADTVIGGTGNDALTGQTWSDAIFGGDGMDFINGGFGHDRVNGGTGADRFYHLGVEGHGSDWIQDFSDEEGDLLVFGGTGATVEDFQVNFTETANAGAAGVEEAFVIYRPTGQILWALVDGGAQDEIMLQLDGMSYDLLA
ncbi:calcium-binding protein [Salipiger abyssi]|uniref:calcium-binding protein n=1 Tax=Salipiger abyssi TaxID=1250539 RepID=UPI00405A00C2